MFHKHRTVEELPLVLLTSLGRRAEDLDANRFVACLSKPIKASQLYDALISITGLPGTRSASAATGPKLDPAGCRCGCCWPRTTSSIRRWHS
jgi:hypothetical protein